MATWFDESRLDDEAALATADVRLRELAESGARVRREAAESEAGVAAAVATARDAADRGRSSPPDPTRACCVPCSSRGARCRSSPGRVRRCPAGPAGSTWSSSLLPTARTGPPRPPSPRPCGAGASVVVASPEGSLVAGHAEGRWSTIVPTVTRDQLATAVVCWSTSTRSVSARGPTPRRSRRRSTTWPSPARPTATSPSTRPRCSRSRSPTPTRSSGAAPVLAARAARRVAETIRRATGRSALAGDAEHLLPLIEAARPPRRVRRPVRRRRAPGTPARAAGPRRRHRRPGRQRGPRAGSRRRPTSHGVRVETVTTEAATEVARYASLVLSGRYARGVPPPRARRRLIAGGVLSARDRGTTGVRP